MTDKERKKFEKNPRLKVTGEYAKKAFPETYKKRQKTQSFGKIGLRRQLTL